MTILETITWVDVCSLDQLTPDRGSCVFVEPYQIALFRLSSDDEVHAISNYDPYSGAYVMSRGIIGSRGDVVKVTSIAYMPFYAARHIG